MKIQISNMIKDDIYFNTVVDCIDSFLTYENRFGLFNENYKDHIFQIIDDFKRFNKSCKISKVAVEIFIHDYTFLSKYKCNPSLYIPIEHYKKSPFFQIDLTENLHLSIENHREDIKFITNTYFKDLGKNIITFHPKDNYGKDFKDCLFNHLIKPKINSLAEFSECTQIEHLTDDDISIINMFNI